MPTRFLVSHVDTARLLTAAKRAGWTENSDSSPMDFVEPTNFETDRGAPNLGLAVSVAKKVLPLDWFGVVRVYKQEKEIEYPHDWETVHTYEVDAEGICNEWSR